GVGLPVGVGHVVLGLVLHDPLERLPGQVQAGEAGVAVLQLRDDAQALAVVVEAAHVPRQLVERLLARVTERRVAEVVGQRDRLGQVLVEAQGAGDARGHLRDLEGVRQARPVVVALVVHEHLGLVLQAPERARVQHAVPVLLESGAVAALALRGHAPARLGGEAGVPRQRLALVPLELLPGDEHDGWYGTTAWTSPRLSRCASRPSTTRVASHSGTSGGRWRPGSRTT